MFKQSNSGSTRVYAHKIIQSAMSSHARGVLLASVLAGCQPEPCQWIEDAALWSARGDERVCVIGDLVVVDRGADELAALTRVEVISGSLIIFDNPGLSEMPRLSALTRIGGSISISSNRELVAIHGFPVLEEVGGTLYIGENLNLVTAELGAGVTALDSVFVALNPRLTALHGFESLQHVPGDFVIRDNAELATLELPALEDVGRNLILSNLPALRVASFPSLRRISGSLQLSGTGELASLSGFSSLDDVEGTVLIDSNEALEECVLNAPLGGLQELVIRDNPVLEHIHGDPYVLLASTTTVEVSANPTLQTLSGFEGVRALAGLIVENNDSLSGIDAWTGLTSIRSGAGLRLLRNSAFLAAPGLLPALESAEEIWIFGNAALDPSFVTMFAERIETEGIPRVGDNMGEDTVLDPCPWPEDGVCDGLIDMFGHRGTELCLTDTEDCGG